MEYSGVVFLLGAPGAGKSALGRLLSQTHSQTVYDFVNVGEQLRATGKVQKHLQHPTQMGKKQLAQLARGILEEVCRDFKKHMAQSRSGDVPVCSTSAARAHLKGATSYHPECIYSMDPGLKHKA